MPSSQNAQSFLVHPILPANELHLLGGPSGAGKTRLLFQTWREWRDEHRFLEWDTETGPPETLYVAYDRSAASIAQTMQDFPKLDLPWVSHRNQNISPMRLPELYPKVKLFLVDGIATQIESGKTQDYSSVSGYVRALGKCCEIHAVTFWGQMHSAKTKAHEGYENPRQKLHGSVAWAAFSDTIFILEPIEPKNPMNRERRLYICPRNAAECYIDYKFDDRGHLLRLTDEDGTSDIILTLIPSADPGIQRKDLLRAIENDLHIPMPTATFDRMLKSLKNDGKVRQSKYGFYMRALIQ
jgi:hypothetical protein